MLIFLIIPAILMLPVVIYMFFFIKRIVNIFDSGNKIRWKKWLTVGITILLLIPALYVWSFQAVIVIYIAGIAVTVDVIRFIFLKITNRQHQRLHMIYCSGLVPILATTMIFGYGYVNIHNVEQKDYDIYTDKNIRAEGYNIAFLSDLHFGTTMDLNQLEDYCRRIEEENPDAVILGGDIVDENTSLEQMQSAFKAISGIDNSYGIFFVYGNHDKARYSVNSPFSEEQLSEAVLGNGIRILADDTFELNNELNISGRLDESDSLMYNISRKSATSLFEKSGNSKFNIIIDHQPRGMVENQEAGYDLMLSGHTHAGQIWPVGIFTDVFDKNTVNYGQKTFGNMELVVSSGIAGWGYPVRTEQHCEYVMIHIRKNAQ